MHVEAKCLKFKLIAQRYKKRCQRLINDKQKNSKSPSPRKRVRHILSSGQKVVKRKLLLGEVMTDELKQGGRTCKSGKDKQLIAQLLSGKILKKYRLLGLTRPFLSPYQYYSKIKRQNCNYRLKKRSSAIQEQLKCAVQKFFEEDENSTMAAGKSECITRGKIQQQKRYLTETVTKLHKKFMETSATTISYASFCRLKPFWVVQRKVTGRDTCMCVKHTNFQLIVDKLHQKKVLNHNKAANLCDMLCCDQLQKECMYRQCQRCKNKDISVIPGPDTSNEQISYYQWISKKEVRTDKNNKTIEVKFTKKERLQSTVEKLVDKAKCMFPDYLRHVYNVSHHFLRLKELKTLMQSNEVIVIVDFSENYICKQSSEVQSAHFGASKQQVSLHTGVMYKKICNEIVSEDVNHGNIATDTSMSVTEPECISFCSVSASYRHDACAIWAHLKPVLNLITDCPEIDTIHMYSDGPTTQYRNKTNLFLMAHFASEYGFKEVTWTFCESGHGKGPADGIGGVIKRTADRAVANGADISNAEMLIQFLRSSATKVHIFEVLEADIEKVDAVPSTLKPIPNTMQVHQVTWNCSKPDTIGLRYLSCNVCVTDTCIHYSMNPAEWKFNAPSIGKVKACKVPPKKRAKRNLKQANTEVSNIVESRTVPALVNDVGAQSGIIPTIDSGTEELHVIQSDTLLSTAAADIVVRGLKINVNNWIAAVYNDIWYPGIHNALYLF